MLRREDLLAVAAESFAQGYAATSVRALARQLGVSQSAVQHHAATKEDLLRAVVDEVLVPSLAATRDVALAVPSSSHARPEDALRSLVRARVEALATHGGLVLAVLTDTSRGADARREHLLRALAPTRESALGALRGLASSGVTRQLSTTTWTVVTAVMVPALAQAWPLLDRLEPGAEVDRAAVLDEVADLLVHGLLPRPTPGRE